MLAFSKVSTTKLKQYWLWPEKGKETKNKTSDIRSIIITIYYLYFYPPHQVPGVSAIPLVIKTRGKCVDQKIHVSVRQNTTTRAAEETQTDTRNIWKYYLLLLPTRWQGEKNNATYYLKNVQYFSLIRVHIVFIISHGSCQYKNRFF